MAKATQIVEQKQPPVATKPAEELVQETVVQQADLSKQEQLDPEEKPTDVQEQAPKEPTPEDVVETGRSTLSQTLAAVEKDEPILARSVPYDYFISEIQSYCVAMAPGKQQDDGVGAAWQVRLFRALTGMAKLTGPDFRAGMDRALELFAEHIEGALSPRMTQRWFHDMRMTKRDCDNFLRLINLLQVASNENTRARLREFVSPEKTFADFETTEAQLFLAYFGN